MSTSLTAKSTKADQQWCLLCQKYLALTDLERHRLIVAGIPLRDLKKLQSAFYPMPIEELHQFMGYRPSADDRDSFRLTLPVSNAFMGMLELTSLAVKIYGNRQVAFEWLRKPLRVTGGLAPFEFAVTTAGLEVIRTLLMQAEHGIYT